MAESSAREALGVTFDRAGRGRSQPFWIETAAGAIFAWHDAPAGEAREAAVVLCRPFGYDAQCTQRAYRHLATRLRDTGFHVLRLDYHGTGDSSGDDTAPDLLSTWLDSVRAGTEWARARLGVDKIALFGAGFGALVALEAASREDVDALLLFAPPKSGRAWLREARALQWLADASRGRKSAPLADGCEESAGFLLTGPMVRALEKLDPSELRCTARAALVVARDDVPGGEQRLIASLKARGVEAALSRSPGYKAMMREDPHKSVVPDAVWSEVASWLAAHYASGARVCVPSERYPVAATVREKQTSPDLREEAVDMDGLFGIVTESPGASRARRVPDILLHNIGANSHTGANRMYVRMARRWAALGFRVLRFDTAGLGDSPDTARTPENRVYSASAKEDSRRAMDFLARSRGARRFVVMGLCSGAYVSFHSALADDRVVAVVLVNILLFHWKEGDSVDVRKRDLVKSTHYYYRTFFLLDMWRRLVRGEVKVNVVAQGLLAKGVDGARHRLGRTFLGESSVARGFRSLLRRGADVLLVFDADDGGRDVIDEHLGTDADRFRGSQAFRLEVIDGADHTFSSLWAQDTLLSLITSHLTRLFAVEPASIDSP